MTTLRPAAGTKPGTARFFTPGNIPWSNLGIEFHYGTGVCDVLRISDSALFQREVSREGLSVWREPEHGLTMFFRCRQSVFDCLVSAGLDRAIHMFYIYILQTLENMGPVDSVLVLSGLGKNVLNSASYLLIGPVSRYPVPLLGFLFGEIYDAWDGLASEDSWFRLRQLIITAGFGPSQMEPVLGERSGEKEHGFIRLESVTPVEFYQVENVKAAELFYRAGLVCEEWAQRVAQMDTSECYARNLLAITRGLLRIFRLAE